MSATRWLLRTVLLLTVCAVLGAVLGAAGTPAAGPPGIPTSVSVTPGDAAADVTWLAPAADGGDPIYRYTVTVIPGGDTVDVPGVARSATVPGLEDGVAYRFTVTARNRVGAGPPSAVSDAVVAAPAAGPAGPVVVREDFAAGPGGMRPVAGGTWEVASGRYALSAPADGGAEVANANLAVHDTVVTGDFTLTAAGSATATDSPFNDFSVVFGYRDPANYWFASFSEGNDANTSGLFEVTGGRRREWADITTPVVAGTVYPVRVERRGGAVRVFRSGEQVAAVGGVDVAPGEVGFGSRNDGGTFDDLLVVGPAPPPPPPPAPPGFLARVWSWVRSLFSDAPSPRP